MDNECTNHNKKNRNQKPRALTIKVIFYLTCLIWFVSYAQLQFMSSEKTSLIVRTIGYFWIVGLALDVVSSLFFIMLSLLSRKSVSLLSLSLPFYFLAFFVNCRPSLLTFGYLSPIAQSLLKTSECLILMTFHLVLTSILPQFVDTYMMKKKL